MIAIALTRGLLPNPMKLSQPCGKKTPGGREDGIIYKQ